MSYRDGRLQMESNPICLLEKYELQDYNPVRHPIDRAIRGRLSNTGPRFDTPNGRLEQFIRFAKDVSGNHAGFNTDGRLKTDVNDMPSDLGDDQQELDGLYVKVTDQAIRAAADAGRVQQCALLEPEVLFDSLLARESFKPRPNKFYLATIIIHGG
ncbi:hypothetical protein V8E54_013510 [Elaphomyces granulatus]